MQEYILFISIALIIVLSPGPDFILVLNNSLSQGLAKGYATAYGIVVGQFIHASAFILGISFILAKSPMLFGIIKYIGAFYLLYLGIRALFSKQASDYTTTFTKKIKANRLCFVEGLTSTIFNPKVILFYITFMPQFIHSEANFLTQTSLLTATFIIIVISWYTLFLCLIKHIEPWFKKGRTQTWLNRIAGVALISISASLLLKQN